jgi:uncharacterized membrane protein
MAQEVQTELISMLRETVDAIQAATPDALDVAATVLWLDALSAVLFGVPMLVLAVLSTRFTVSRFLSVMRSDAFNADLAVFGWFFVSFLGAITAILSAGSLLSTQTILGLFAPDLALAYRAMHVAGLV